jgi:ABC-type Mn2+/Zn2+ transport system permease subunit
MSQRSGGLGRMRQMLGLSGFFGLLCIVGGIALLATVELEIAAGVALVLAGLGFLVRAMIKGVMSMMGMGGMM